MTGKDGVKAFAGLAPDLFAGDAAALGKFRAALIRENRFAAEAWENRQNFFARRNITAIVLEVPTEMIGRGQIHAWATASLYGHAPEVQVSRWGLPLITNVLILDEAVRETYNRIGPAEDREKLGAALAQFAAHVSGLAGSTPNPSEYGRQVADRLCPIVLPYELGSEAAFHFAGFNGRALGDDVMDVIITLASNVATADGVARTAAAYAPISLTSGLLLRPRSRPESRLPFARRGARETLAQDRDRSRDTGCPGRGGLGCRPGAL